MISNRKPTYQDLLERTRGAQYRVHQNTRAGWYNIGQLNTAIQKDMYKEYLFMVDIPADPKDESNDVLNLQYYFVRTERALRTKRELGENAVFILLVTVHSQDDRFRVSSYLHLQSVHRTDMLFYISYSGHIYEPQKDLEGIRRLCPLICVTKTKTWNNLFYQNLLKGAKLTERQIICCRDTAIKVLQTESGKKYQGSDKDDLMTSNEGGGTGDEALAQDDTDNNKKQRSRLQNLIKSEEFKTKDQRINLQIITANYLMEGFCKIKGVKGKPLQVKEKCILINEVCDYILQRNEPLTLLGQLIWFLYIYYIQDSNEFIEWDHGADKDKIHITRYDRLEKSYMDSMEYTDGILQLLENSCQHTQSGVGYLSIRVHYVDKNGCPEGELTDVAASRSRLINRYSHGFVENSGEDEYFPRRMVIDDSIPYYFELRVIDDATYYDKNNGENGNTVRARGIVEMYGLNNELSSDKWPYLYSIFGRLTEDEEQNYGKLEEPSESLLNKITHHYGVRLLQKITLRNRGRFMVVTPGKDAGFTDIYSACDELALPGKQKPTVHDGKELRNGDVILYRNVGWKQITRRETCRSTEYQIILPLSYRWKDTGEDKSIHFQPTPLPIDLYALKKGISYIPTTEHCLADEFGPVFAENPYFTYSDDLPYEEVTSDELSKEKIKITSALSRQLRNMLADENDINKIHVLNFSTLSGTQLELSTKALFRYIGEQKLSAPVDGADGRMLFAVCFDHVLQAREFIMNYSVFYDELGVNPFMENVQIAVCTIKESTANDADSADALPEVNFLLTGTSLSTSWKTAETFAFYNSNRTLSLLPQLQYLSDNSFWVRTTRKSPEAVAAFPFDIYLRGMPKGPEKDNSRERQEPEQARAASTEKPHEPPDVLPADFWDCWFLEHMVNLIKGNVQASDMGCMIKGVHVRLGSRMHIEDFYEAELLFQNISVVNRFAYMIVQAILKNRPRAQAPLLIVGYENYSTILLEYVVDFLAQCGKEAAYGLYGYDVEGKGKFNPSAALNMKGKVFWDNCQVITIYPIGTTLSTIYRMVDSVHIGRRVNPYMNFCILLIGDKNEEHTLRKKFWIKEEEKKQRRTQSQERGQETGSRFPPALMICKDKDQREEMYVNYFLEAKTFWHDAQECLKDRPEIEEVLTYVDSTSTVPNMIFPLTSRRNDGPSSFLSNGEGKKNDNAAKNNGRLEELKGCLYYGHINVGNNHFLYNIDLPLYFEHVRSHKSEDLYGWLDNLHKTIDAEAFNMIVSPLDRDNAAFLQEVVDKVFAHSIRVLRIPFLESRKEDIRAKFSFISQEYKRIKAINPSININIYYVSMSVVTGETFHRASKLIGMLLDDSGLRKKNDFLFKGVFLLVNRSSRSTIQTMVEDPDRDFHAYLHLSVPHYNTYKGICPACMRFRRNQVAVRNCSTNICSEMFLRLEEKLTLRTRQEHRQWLQRELYDSERGFTMLCLWLYRHREKNVMGFNQEGKKQLIASCIKIQQGNADGRIYLKDHLKDILHGLTKKDVLTENDLRKKLSDLWMDEVLQDMAFMRLSCTHNAYSILEDDELLQNEPEELPKKARERILELFKDKQNESPEEFIEWIISYIKVLSREYLAKHYYIRKSVFKILSEVLRFVLDEPLTDRYQKETARVLAACKEALPLQQYQLLLTVLRQLAGMQANMVMRNEILLDIGTEIDDLCRKQDALCAGEGSIVALCPLPSETQIEADYERCIKWEMLSGDEESKCFLLSDQQSIWEAADSK